jgi:hypothetical protein
VPFKMSNLNYNWWEVGWFLEVTINPPLEVPPPGYGWIYMIISSQNPNKNQYEITIGNFLACTCLDFVTMIFCLLSRRGKWVPYKHMYYVLQHVVFVANLKVSSIFQLGIVMKFVACWIAM